MTYEQTTQSYIPHFTDREYDEENECWLYYLEGESDHRVEVPNNPEAFSSLIFMLSDTAETEHGLDKKRLRILKRLPEAMLDMLGKFSDREVGKLFGFTTDQVCHSRIGLGIPSNNLSKSKAIWTEAHTYLLGKMSDADAAEKIGVSPETIRRKRDELGIPPYAKRRSRS